MCSLSLCISWALSILTFALLIREPPVRRIPPLLWVRLRRDLGEFLVEVGSDARQLYRWAHEHFRVYVETVFLKRPARKSPHRHRQTDRQIER